MRGQENPREFRNGKEGKTRLSLGKGVFQLKFDDLLAFQFEDCVSSSEVH